MTIKTYFAHWYIQYKAPGVYVVADNLEEAIKMFKDSNPRCTIINIDSVTCPFIVETPPSTSP
jgi:hypothetical protein